MARWPAEVSGAIPKVNARVPAGVRRADSPGGSGHGRTTGTLSRAMLLHLDGQPPLEQLSVVREGTRIQTHDALPAVHAEAVGARGPVRRRHEAVGDHQDGPGSRFQPHPRWLAFDPSARLRPPGQLTHRFERQRVHPGRACVGKAHGVGRWPVLLLRRRGCGQGQERGDQPGRNKAPQPVSTGRPRPDSRKAFESRAAGSRDAGHQCGQTPSRDSPASTRGPGTVRPPCRRHDAPQRPLPRVPLAAVARRRDVVFGRRQ